MTMSDQNEGLLDRARLVIRELREKLSAAEAKTAPQQIAIVGMAGRFPGAGDDLEAFWRMIADGKDAVTQVPAERWDSDFYYSATAPVRGKTNMRRAAFLTDVANFDAAFFDVPPVEAGRMDPQQRIFLQTAWHALEDAGLTAEALRGSDTGVFVGIHGASADYAAMQFADLQTLDEYAATGTAHDVIAGRLSYWLDLRGPSMIIDTACSSSLVALHVACRSLRARDCDCAVVGGVHLILSPRTSVAMSQLQMLADDGSSKTFDSRADGFGRGEGCGVVVLKRLCDAQRDQDRILAVIRGSAINQDGRTNGLTAPSGLAQQRLLRRALQDAGVLPSDIGYIEAHGTGTALGDPIEVEAIAEVLGGRERSTPCVLGSVKANVGHLEGAAGMAGVIKIVLAMQHEFLPPVAHLEKLNPRLALNGSGLAVLNYGQEWPRGVRRCAGVSSFGWSGTNAHVVLEEALEQSTGSPSNLPVLVAVSAKSQEGLRKLAAKFAERIENSEGQELAAIGYTSCVRRTHYPHRFAVAGSDGRKMAAQLRSEIETPTGVNCTTTVSGADSGRLRRLKDLACAYQQGTTIEWKEIYPSDERPVSLPQYPFHERPYWWHGATPSNRSGAPRVAEDASMINKLRLLSPRDRFDSLLAFVGEQVRVLFGMTESESLDESRGLVEMGMNSLMAVMLETELETALNVKLSATVMLDYPNLLSLSRFLDEKLFGDKPTAPPAGKLNATETQEQPSDVADIAAMNQTELDAALAAELAAIRQPRVK